MLTIASCLPARPTRATHGIAIFFPSSFRFRRALGPPQQPPLGGRRDPRAPAGRAPRPHGTAAEPRAREPDAGDGGGDGGDDGRAAGEPRRAAPGRALRRSRRRRRRRRRQYRRERRDELTAATPADATADGERRGWFRFRVGGITPASEYRYDDDVMW